MIIRNRNKRAVDLTNVALGAILLKNPKPSIMGGLLHKIKHFFITNRWRKIGLAESESLPGGEAPIYLKYKVIKGLKIKGSLKPDK